MELTLYQNGTIITMCKEDEIVEAVLVEDDHILAAGSKEEMNRVIEGYKNVNIKYEDLNGYTMLPSFIDAHSHFTSYAAGLLSVSMKDANNFEDIITIIQNSINERDIPKGEWIICKEYDHNSLQEKRHPDRFLLDQAAPDNPVILSHQSGHVGVFNTKALEVLGVTIDTVVPEGGVIEKKNNKLKGYMEENAFFLYQKQTPALSVTKMKEAFKEAQAVYASYGITTMQEGMIVEQMLPLLQILTSEKLLYLDLVGYAMVGELTTIMKHQQDFLKDYRYHYRLGGCKTVLDGLLHRKPMKDIALHTQQVLMEKLYIVQI